MERRWRWPNGPVWRLTTVPNAGGCGWTGASWTASSNAAPRDRIGIEAMTVAMATTMTTTTAAGTTTTMTGATTTRMSTTGATTTMTTSTGVAGTSSRGASGVGRSPRFPICSAGAATDLAGDRQGRNDRG